MVEPAHSRRRHPSTEDSVSPFWGPAVSAVMRWNVSLEFGLTRRVGHRCVHPLIRRGLGQQFDAVQCSPQSTLRVLGGLLLRHATSVMSHVSGE